MTLVWQPDVLPGFSQATLSLARAYDGPAEAVLVRRLLHGPAREAVLYVHGFSDYFFQTHLADFFNAQGLHFYAIDLRRHGRALRPYQRPNDTRDVSEFFEDLDAAVSVIDADWLLINGHSTGGLIAALYADRGAKVDALFLNSPFFAMNLPRRQRRYLEPAVAALGRVWPGYRLPGLPTLYGETIRDWDFDRRWKPDGGFPVHAGWFRAMHRAHEQIARGLRIEQPILVLHAERSASPSRRSDRSTTSDIVLDVRDMQRLAPRLGSHVRIEAIPNAIHDLVLSHPAARAATFAAVEEWLEEITAARSRTPRPTASAASHPSTGRDGSPTPPATARS